MQSSKPRKQIFGRQRQLKDILATHESNVINTTGLETKARTKDEVFGERIKPDDIQSRIAFPPETHSGGVSEMHN